MSETPKYEVNIEDFTGKELDVAITLLVSLAAKQEMEVPEAPEMKNKSQQGDYINQLVAVVGMIPSHVTEENLETFEGAKVGDVVIISQELGNESSDDSSDDASDEEEEGENAGEGDSEDNQTPPDQTPAPSVPEPTANKGKEYQGEQVVRTANRLINGRRYVEITTVSASYTVSPEEAKEAGIKV